LHILEVYDKYTVKSRVKFKEVKLNMEIKHQHVVPHQGLWAVRGEGNLRVTSIHPTQFSAYQVARKIAINKRAEVLIHRPNGRIRDKDSFGNDPYPPKDKRN
jgi:hypothetical protein